MIIKQIYGLSLKTHFGTLDFKWFVIRMRGENMEDTKFLKAFNYAHISGTLGGFISNLKASITFGSEE